MSDSMNNEILFKVIIVGDPAVGKSCILNKFVLNEFHENYSVTIGVEFSSKIVAIDENILVSLQIWDTAGQDSFRSIIKSFYRNAAAAFLVYDVTNPESLGRLDFWFKEVRENASRNTVLILVGNKQDLESERKISYEKGLEIMKKEGCALFFETSAKNGVNVEEAFNQTAKLVFMNYISGQFNENEEQKGKSLKQTNIIQKKKCCF